MLGVWLGPSPPRPRPRPRPSPGWAFAISSGWLRDGWGRVGMVADRLEAAKSN